MGDLFLVAVTGAMGCGKSAVSRRLATCGAFLLDADQDARAVLMPGSEGWRAVLARFGAGILCGPVATEPLDASATDAAWPAIDRRLLGEQVFRDPQARAELEQIIHPRIFQRQAERLARWQKATPSGSVTIVVADIPLLFETESDGKFDLTVAVVCGAQQWQRLQGRVGMSVAVQKAVVAQQLSESEKQRRANKIIDNRGAWRDTERQVTALWSDMQVRARGVVRRAWPRAWPSKGLKRPEEGPVAKL